MALRRIGQILVDLGYISDEQLELLVEEQQQRPGQLLGQVAMDLGLIDDEKLAQALGEQMSLRTVALGDLTIKPEVLALVAEPMAQMYRIVPTECDGTTLTVAMCDPQNLAVQDELRTFLVYNIAVVVATEPAILAALDRYYGENTECVERIVTDL
jgi:type IV pilus assembly protein PilB